MLKTYYYLTKPGIIYGNLTTAAAGFLLASKGHINWVLLIATLAGTSLVIASACVFNNYIDRNIDKAMARTKKRAMVEGIVSPLKALGYATILGLVGFMILIWHTNALVIAIGVIAFIDYVILYGYTKRTTVHGTLVGSIAGAAPVVAGYCAVSDRFNSAALILFLILAVWQMPHFYAIAMRRFGDYKAAKLPVMPVKYGMKTTKVQILIYVVGFIVVTDLLAFLHYTGRIYFVVMTLLGLTWLWFGIKGFNTKDDTAWAKKMFLFSLIVLLCFSLLLGINAWII